jgi:hypothetical protein
MKKENQKGRRRGKEGRETWEKGENKKKGKKKDRETIFSIE